MHAPKYVNLGKSGRTREEGRRKCRDSGCSQTELAVFLGRGMIETAGVLSVAYNPI